MLEPTKLRFDLRGLYDPSVPWRENGDCSVNIHKIDDWNIDDSVPAPASLVRLWEQCWIQIKRYSGHQTSYNLSLARRASSFASCSGRTSPTTLSGCNVWSRSGSSSICSLRGLLSNYPRFSIQYVPGSTLSWRGVAIHAKDNAANLSSFYFSNPDGEWFKESESHLSWIWLIQCLTLRQCLSAVGVD